MGRGADGSAKLNHKIPKTSLLDNHPQHKQQQDIHVILYGKLVDVTTFAHNHPGGAKALRIFDNRDATEQFEMYHSPAAHKMMRAMAKNAPDAPPEKEVSKSTIGADFARLTRQFHDMGLFEPNYADEAFKVALTLLPGVLGFYLLNAAAASPCLGSLLVAFSFYMSGWTSHDYLHHGVLKGSQRNLVARNNAIGYAFGAWQGYAVEWWRARHNTHHLVTNEHGNDPDIKTAPVLVYVRNNPKIAAALNAVQRWQQYYYVPAMCMMDIYWRVESIQYLLARPAHKVATSWATLAIHYAALAALFSGPGYGWMLFMMLCRGFMTGIVVFSTHYGEDILDSGDHKMTLVEQTALTSRNITGGYVVNLLTGYISLQTEHHLWPMMPTCHLEKAQPLCRAFFRKHGLHYRESNLAECVRYNIKALKWEHVVKGH